MYISIYIYIYICIHTYIYIYYALMCAKVPVTVFDINMSIYHLLLLLLWAAIVLVVLGVDIAHPLLNQVIVVSSCRVLSCTTGSGFSTHLAASLHVRKISKCGSSPTFSSDFGIKIPKNAPRFVNSAAAASGILPESSANMPGRSGSHP